jgi:hypothetical protein
VKNTNKGENQQGNFLKIGWSNVGKNGGGMQLRIGIGKNLNNTNQALYHFYIPNTFVPNYIANPYIINYRKLFRY